MHAWYYYNYGIYTHWYNCQKNTATRHLIQTVVISIIILSCI